ncbi:MAG: MarR family transcriptional regulator [Candidatus Paceibacterota bacterium]
MSAFFNKIQTVLNNRTTYTVGLLQTKAYRTLKQSTTQSLEKYDISALEWGFVGALYSTPAGMLQGEIAEVLGVEAPFITVLTTSLVKKGLIEKKHSPKDSRAKITCITPYGKVFVENTEKHLLVATRPLLADVSARDIVGYLTVLEKIIENSKLQVK